MLQSSKLYNHCIAELHNMQVPATPIRRAILTVLSQATQPMTARQILEAIRDQGVSAHRATVYRDIELCVKNGLVNEYSFKQKAVLFYELVTDHHHHMMCENCGTIQAVYPKEVEEVLDQFQESLRRSDSFVVTSHRLKFYGTCKNCLQKRQKSST